MNENKTNINWYPGHMAKTRREINELLPLIDVVYEVIDSRMPLSSRIIDIDEIAKSKPKILIFTKYDICDKKYTDEVIDYYKKNNNIVINVDLIKGTNIDKIISETSKISSNINEERKRKGLKPRNVRALVLGVPNVGKSTLINRLVGKKSAKVGNIPGVTKQLNWIRIGKNIELLDSPGILWPKLENQEYAYNLAAFSSIKEEIIDIESLAIYILEKMNCLYKNELLKRYNIDMYCENVLEYIDIIGKKRGAYKKGGEIDYDKVYKIIIKDLKDGNFGNVTFDRL